MKLRLPPWTLKLAYKFIDVEAFGESAVVDGRVLEYGFAVSKLCKLNHQSLLDVGYVARMNPILEVARRLGWVVHGIDVRKGEYTQGDIEEFFSTTARDLFDCITCISTLEHIGINGRYGINKKDLEKDKRVVEVLHRLLRPGGTLIVTAPVGKENKVGKLGRVYEFKYLTYNILGAFRLKENELYEHLEGTWRRVDKVLGMDGLALMEFQV